MSWDPGRFAPSLCSSENSPMLDYILSDRAPVFGDGTSMYARPLYEEEKQKYLPVFQEMFPGFTMEQMESVHYCAYTWYDGTEAPYCY